MVSQIETLGSSIVIKKYIVLCPKYVNLEIWKQREKMEDLRAAIRKGPWEDTTCIDNQPHMFILNYS